MGLEAIPVHLFNPGQVFACLGFLEAADVLLGDAVGGFDWTDERVVRFVLQARGGADPFASVLQFLAQAEVAAYGPEGGRESEEGDGGAEVFSAPDPSTTFPTGRREPMALPVRLTASVAGEVRRLDLSHWAEGATMRRNFKLYAGNRSAEHIAVAMLQGSGDKPPKGSRGPGRMKTLGVRALWSDDAAALRRDPFGRLVPMGGSFNFDPRGAWTGLDAGYSPNRLSHLVAASPVVEILAAVGLENARPHELGRSQVRYGAWRGPLPPSLARPALGAVDTGVPLRTFRFTLAASGKNRVVTFAEEETRP